MPILPPSRSASGSPRASPAAGFSAFKARTHAATCVESGRALFRVDRLRAAGLLEIHSSTAVSSHALAFGVIKTPGGKSCVSIRRLSVMRLLTTPFATRSERWIPTRSATPSTALVPQRKVGFPIPNAGLLLGFQGTKTARRKGISSPFSDPGGCTSPQNSGGSGLASLVHSWLRNRIAASP